MSEIFRLMPVLAVVITLNILLGIYNSIKIENFRFSKEKLLNGILKALIVAGSFIGFAYVFSMIDLSSAGITPLLVMQVSIITYATKGITNLAKIMGISSLIEKNGSSKK
ncbi:hypothetical protein [Murimonas intestini]|uniref:Holin n=1 Tax=Murimonas intestini TaxID=1337051 RepID=A0AB73T231_9FIRM|nr:hypothetical protein [Murimonas intestini]MCR1842500.1 hypothetical protein [Murimonas intestini]MCR1867142.1 hypothetical protein [Murimonas intestini]MCR1884328.1 hypothetical protein [Murimonas intestini]